jgi:hypothetical protein
MRSPLRLLFAPAGRLRGAISARRAKRVAPMVGKPIYREQRQCRG